MTSSAEPATGRLDSYLVRAGLARSRQRATELIRSGLVSVDDRPVARPAYQLGGGERIVVAPDRQTGYVSRGALKLSGALDDLAVAVAGRRCLDAGASTGGFTQVLLERGACQVIAVDVGTGQLAEQVRSDPRVRDLPRTHLAELDPAAIGGPAELVVADLSFISLRDVMASLCALTAPDGDLLPMVKPQFEVGRHRLGSGGVVRDPEDRRAAVLEVARSAAASGLALHGIVESSAPGPAGNREYFLHLRRQTPFRTPEELWATGMAS